MLRHSLFIALLSVASAAADTKPSTEERRAVSEFQAQFESSCRNQLEAKLREPHPSPLPSLSKWLAEMAEPSTYCACTANLVAQGLTTEMLRSGLGPDGSALVKQSGIQCILPKLKATFPLMCRDMIRDVTGIGVDSTYREAVASEFCGCSRAAVDALSVTTFEPVMAATMRDYAEYQRSRNLPSPQGGSLIAQMNACGVTELRARLQVVK